MLEALEERRVLAAVVQNGVLVVTGSAGGDVMTLSAGSELGVVVVRGVPGVADNTAFSGITRVKVNAKGGNDFVTVQGSPRDPGGSFLRFVLNGQGGDDTLIGGPGDDIIRGQNGRDTLQGGEGNDQVFGGKGDDFIDGQGGDDSLEGNDGRDTILGGPGDDYLKGGAGDDRLRGGSGNDVLRGGIGRDDVYGGAGTDQIFGDRDRDIFRGLLSEFRDFSKQDANNFDVITSNPDRGTLSNFFWSELDRLVGEGDLTPDMVKATDALQLLRARSADEGDDFDDEFGDLSSSTRRDVRDCTEDMIDEYLDDMYDNPEDINESSMRAIRTVLQPCFPGRVQDEFYDYFEALIELDNQLRDFGRALDRMENTMTIDPWFREFEDFFLW